jgi:hypothetical protein
MRFLRALGRFWYDFIVGDDWRIAAGVVLVLAAGAALVAAGGVSHDVLVPLIGAGIVGVVSVSIVAGPRRQPRG